MQPSIQQRHHSARPGTSAGPHLQTTELSTSSIKLNRYEGNPILGPHADHDWEDLAVFNPGVWYDSEQQKFIMLYRAAESRPEYRCYFGLAESTDGFNFSRVSDSACLSPSVDGWDASTIQDPRIVKMGDWFYVTYAARHFPFGQYWKTDGSRYRWPQSPDEFPAYLRHNATLSGLALTQDFKTWVRAGVLTDPNLDDRDVILFPRKINGKYYMIHRPLQWHGDGYPCAHPAIWISAADDLLDFRESTLLAKQEYDWESGKIGANTPPILTSEGWLILYHAVGEDLHYRLGAMLLDKDDPTIVRCRTKHWIMQPETDYEIDGYYKGCIFPCGKVVVDDTLYVYYGAADKYCAVATCSLSELLEYLQACKVG